MPALVSTHVTPNAGDPVLITWILEHQARALLDDPGSLYQGNIFFPDPHAIAWSDNLTALVPPYLVLWLASGRDSVFAYNTVSWLAFAGAGLAVLLLARRLLDSPIAATVVAVAFSVAMVRRSAVGHTQLAGFAMLPLALVALMDVCERRRLTGAVLGGVALAALWYSAIYFFVLAVVVVPIFVVVWALTNRGDVGLRVIGLLALTAVVTGALVAPSAAAYRDVSERASFVREDDELVTIGTHSFGQPPSLVYLALGEEDGSSEGTDGFVGWTVVALGVVALLGVALDGARRLLAVRRRRHRTRHEAPSRETVALGSDAMSDAISEADEVAAGLDVVAAVEAGSAAEWAWTAPPEEDTGRGRRRRRFAVPIGAVCLAGGLLALGPDDGSASALYDTLRTVVPGLDSARVVSRFWVLAALGLALLAGRGCDRLVSGRPRPLRVGVGLVAVSAILAELLVVPNFTEVSDRPPLTAVNRALADLPPGVVTELPAATGESYPYTLAIRQLRSLEDGLPRIEGYSGGAPDGLDTYLRVASTFPAPASVRALRRAGARYVVLHGDDVACDSRYGPDELSAVAEQARDRPGVEAVRRVGRSAIVTLAPSSRRLALDELDEAGPAGRTTRACDQR